MAGGSLMSAFITFEGIDGVGKSTQIALLAEALRALDIEVVSIREPGSSRVSEAVRALVLDPELGEMTSRTELFLYEAARAQVTDEVIRPALAAGKVVLCDRYYDSTSAYQGCARGLGLAEVELLNSAAAAGLVPDSTILLDIAAESGLSRAAQSAKPDRLEGEGLDFYRRVRRGFLDLAARYPERIHVVDASRGRSEIAAEIRAILRGIFPGLDALASLNPEQL
jgi:dTMP kinase